MGFFDDYDIEEEEVTVEETISQHADDIIYKKYIGDIVYYDKDLEEFKVEDAYTYEYSKSNLIIGLVINQYKDYSIDVLLNGFLNADVIKTPIGYFQPEKLSFIPNYIYDLFKRYCSAYIKKCPNIEKIKNLKLRMPTILHLNNIIDNKDKFAYSLEVSLGKDNAHEFIKKFNRSNMYIIYNKKMYTWTIENEKFKVNNVDVIYGLFLAVTTISL